jgi:hypothetical protein
VSGCGVLYKRQFHPKEETLADRLADESGGKYTEQQIEDQMAANTSYETPTNRDGMPPRIPTTAGGAWRFLFRVAPEWVQVDAAQNRRSAARYRRA